MGRECFHSCLSVCSWGSPWDHYPWFIGTSLYSPLAPAWRPSEHQTWDPSPWACPLWTSDMGPLLLVTSGGHPTRPVQTCLYMDPYQYSHPVAKARTVGKPGGMHPTRMLSCLCIFSLWSNFYLKYKQKCVKMMRLRSLYH